MPDEDEEKHIIGFPLQESEEKPVVERKKKPTTARPVTPKRTKGKITKVTLVHLTKKQRDFVEQKAEEHGGLNNYLSGLVFSAMEGQNIQPTVPTPVIRETKIIREIYTEGTPPKAETPFTLQQPTGIQKELVDELKHRFQEKNNGLKPVAAVFVEKQS